MHRAVNSVPSISNSFPLTSCARTTGRKLRSTPKKIPGNERQPSSPSCLPSCAMTSGLIMTIRWAGSLPPEQSITNRRLGTPTCTAASPTPGAAYIVSNILFTSFLRSASNLVTGSAGLSSTGFGQVTICKRDILKSQISNFKSEISNTKCFDSIRFYDQGLGFASWDLNHRGHREETFSHKKAQEAQKGFLIVNLRPIFPFVPFVPFRG